MKLGSFHVAVVQQGLRNVQKCVMHVQSCSFTKQNFFCCIAFFAVAKTPFGCDPEIFLTIVT